MIGPESTGKTILSEQLAQHYRTEFVPELARTFFEHIKNCYSRHDIEVCLLQQLKEEKEKVAVSNRFLFVDTEAIIAKVWCEDVFHSAPKWINDEIKNNPYDLYLLTNTDVDVEEDEMRFNPHRREYFFDWYLKLLQENYLSYFIVSGKENARLRNSIDAIEKKFTE